jgi:hypothetical protein
MQEAFWLCIHLSNTPQHPAKLQGLCHRRNTWRFLIPLKLITPNAERPIATACTPQRQSLSFVLRTKRFLYLVSIVLYFMSKILQSMTNTKVLPSCTLPTSCCHYSYLTVLYYHCFILLFRLSILSLLWLISPVLGMHAIQ